MVKVIGCGGIGSYLAYHLDRLIELKQINNMKFKFYDDDKVLGGGIIEKPIKK